MNMVVYPNDINLENVYPPHHRLPNPEVLRAIRKMAKIGVIALGASLAILLAILFIF